MGVNSSQRSQAPWGLVDMEEAGLISTRRSGRQKRHFLNAGPIGLILDRWIDKYTERQVSALAELKTSLEGRKWIPANKRA